LPWLPRLTRLARRRGYCRHRSGEGDSFRVGNDLQVACRQVIDQQLASCCSSPNASGDNLPRRLKDIQYLNLIEPWWKVLRSLARKGRRFATWDEIRHAVAAATQYWNAHRHPFTWGQRKRRQRLRCAAR
jgi:hypothetical protein